MSRKCIKRKCKHCPVVITQAGIGRRNAIYKINGNGQFFYGEIFPFYNGFQGCGASVYFISELYLNEYFLITKLITLMIKLFSRLQKDDLVFKIPSTTQIAIIFIIHYKSFLTNLGIKLKLILNKKDTKLLAYYHKINKLV